MRTRTWAVAALVVSACGGKTEKNSRSVLPPPPEVGISVTPQSVSLLVGASQKFTATVTGTADTSVAWSLAEGTAGGAISSDGAYTTPAVAGTYHVVATAGADQTKSASATVVVSPAPVASIAIDPAAADLTPGATLQLRATVSGVPDTAVLWSVREGDAGGSVDDRGLYTAPQAAGLYHVVAAS